MKKASLKFSQNPVLLTVIFVYSMEYSLHGKEILIRVLQHIIVNVRMCNAITMLRSTNAVSLWCTLP